MSCVPPKQQQCCKSKPKGGTGLHFGIGRVPFLSSLLPPHALPPRLGFSLFSSSCCVIIIGTIAARQVRVESTLVRGCMGWKGCARVRQKGFCAEMRSSYTYMYRLYAFPSG